MGVESVLEDDRLEEALGDTRVNIDQYPLRRLVDKFGLEATIRGIKYMSSLEEADRNFRESAKKKENYGDGLKDGFGVENMSEEARGAIDSWGDSVEGGLGLDE